MVCWVWCELPYFNCLIPKFPVQLEFSAQCEKYYVPSSDSFLPDQVCSHLTVEFLTTGSAMKQLFK